MLWYGTKFLVSMFLFLILIMIPLVIVVLFYAAVYMSVFAVWHFQF